MREEKILVLLCTVRLSTSYCGSQSESLKSGRPDSNCDGRNTTVKTTQGHVIQALEKQRQEDFEEMGKKEPFRFWSREGPNESEVSGKCVWQQSTRQAG